MFETQHSQREKQTYRPYRDDVSISFYFYKHQCPAGTVVHPMNLRTKHLMSPRSWNKTKLLKTLRCFTDTYATQHVQPEAKNKSTRRAGSAGDVMSWAPKHHEPIEQNKNRKRLSFWDSLFFLWSPSRDRPGYFVLNLFSRNRVTREIKTASKMDR
jgi:hypothetical protein